MKIALADLKHDNFKEIVWFLVEYLNSVYLIKDKPRTQIDGIDFFLSYDGSQTGGVSIYSTNLIFLILVMLLFSIF